MTVNNNPNAIRTWMYRKALLRTLRFEVFLSSTLGMLRFNVSKHSFKCARLKKTQVVCQLVGACTRNQFSRGLELNLGLNPAKHLHMCIAVTKTTCMLTTEPAQSSRKTMGLYAWILVLALLGNHCTILNEIFHLPVLLLPLSPYFC